MSASQPTDIHIAIEMPLGDDEVSQSDAASKVTASAADSNASDSENVLQLNLTGDSLHKFAKILQDKGLQTAEEAVQYFYSLHNKKEELSTQPSSSRSRGRPKGSRNKVMAEDSSDLVTPGIDLEDEDEPGTVLVDGVRKSTRRKKDPFKKSEYISIHKLENIEDINLGEEQLSQWDVEGDEGLIDIEDNQPMFISPTDVPTQLSDAAPSGDKEHDSQHAIRIIRFKQKTSSYPRVTRTKSAVRTRKGGVGRPRRRAREAVLFKSEEETQNCQRCGEHFATLSALRSHKMKVHSRQNHPYFCEHCEYTAMFECDMKRHQLVHLTEKVFRCHICDFATNWERNLSLHIENVHSNKEPWKCDRCDVKIYNHSKVKQHQLSHNPNALKCNQCDFLFETSAKLQWHINNMHVKELSKLQCTECSYVATTSVNLRLHLKNKHNIEQRQRERQVRRKKEEVCDICNKRLINADQKEVHMQIHEPGNRDNPKPYYCHVCDARCADINQMVRHRAIHSEEKPFACKHCNYRSRWKKDLKTHEMIHTGVKNVHCPHCNYTCYTRQRLRAHLIKHDESRHHLCPLCNMAFKSKQALRMHTMYHTGEAAYSCDLCEFRTVTEMRLKKHKMRHTDERNYSCNLCGKRFKQPHHVTQHRDIVHLGKPSYRERKRIALQQSAAEALGSLNAADIAYSGQTTYTVVNEDGSTTLLDIQAMQPSREAEETQYVMVETPAGYQYVAVVMPETGDVQSAGLVTDTSQVPADTTNMEDSTPLLLSQASGVFYSTSAVSSVEPESGQSVENLVALPTD